jgi:hypothetical protein
MLSSPKVGSRVRIRYNAKVRKIMPLHDAVGVITLSGRGRPRNHEVEVAGVRYCVPCGNLFSDEG